VATPRSSDVLVARLEEQVRELRAALEDAAEAICRIDLEGRVVSTNRAFTRLTGYESSEIVTGIKVFDGDGCGWKTHDDPRAANGLVVTFDEAVCGFLPVNASSSEALILPIR